MPFLDHVASEMETRFGSVHQTQIKLLCLVPCTSVTCTSSSIKDVGELYRSDLPSPQLLSTEFSRWKISVSPNDRPDSLQEALLSCDKDTFPNIAVLLTMACTLPVTTCETERANSQLKLLKTYLRSPWERRGLLLWQTSRSIVEWSQILI